MVQSKLNLNLKEFNPLICVPSPRELPEFYHFFNKITRYDKYQAKYYIESQAYTLLRDYFLRHEEYTHLVLCPDDLLVTNDDFDILINDIERFDYPVVSGICNLSYLDTDNYAASKYVPGEEIKDYVFITKSQVEHWRRNKDYIQGVNFNGFALSFIRRDVITQFPFEGLYGLDRIFGKNCNVRNIPMYIDIRAECFHIKYRMGFDIYEKFYVGKRPTSCIFTEMETVA